MPSPLGHALAGFAAGWLVAGPAAGHPGRGRAEGVADRPALPPGAPARSRRQAWAARHPNVVRAGAFAVVGVLADFDLLVHAHSSYTHSIGMAAFIVVATWLLDPKRRLTLCLGVGAAYLSHPLLDWLGEDGTAPFGVMLGWPLTTRYLHSGLDWFRAISRRYWLPDFWTYNLHATLHEMLLLGPATILVLLIRRKLGDRGR